MQRELVPVRGYCRLLGQTKWIPRWLLSGSLAEAWTCSLKSGGVVSPALFFFLKNAWFCGYIETLGLFFYFCEKWYWNFDRDYTESVHYFGWCGHFNNSPDTWTGYSFPFSVSSNFSPQSHNSFMCVHFLPPWLNLFLSTLFYLLLLHVTIVFLISFWQVVAGV